jgi:hypothetical protein
MEKGYRPSAASRLIKREIPSSTDRRSSACGWVQHQQHLGLFSQEPKCTDDGSR